MPDAPIDATSPSPSWEASPHLPVDCICLILSHLTPLDFPSVSLASQSFAAATRAHRAEAVLATEESLGLLTARSTKRPDERVLLRALRGMSNLVELSLRATNAFSLDGEAFGGSCLAAAVPALKILDLRGQSRITSDALLATVTPLQHLRAIDLTFCSEVRYVDTICLREHCPNLRLIRRVPALFTGTILAANGERQTYYADGAFAVWPPRAEGVGWIAQCKRLGDSISSCGRGGHHHTAVGIETRLIFGDNAVDDLAPQAHNGRCGVLMRAVVDAEKVVMERPEEGGEEDEEEKALAAIERQAERRALDAALVEDAPAPSKRGQKSPCHDVLVVDSTRFPEPPSRFPPLPAALPAFPPRGSSRRGSRVRGPLGHDLHGLRLSRLAMCSLPPPMLMPPAKLVEHLKRLHAPLRGAERCRVFEGRALKSIAESVRGAARFASVMGSLMSPAHPASFFAASRAAWDDEVSSSSSEDEEFGDGGAGELLAADFFHAEAELG